MFAFLRLAGCALIFVAGIAAVAAPKESDIAAYRALVALDLRLATTGYRLAEANAPFCKQKQRSPGWVLHSYRQYPDRETAQAAFRFPTPIAVSALVPNGPAARAGIQAGDGLADMDGGIWFGGEPIKHKPSYALVEGANTLIRALFDTPGPKILTFETGSGAKKFTLDPPPVCASDFQIDPSASMNAGADGKMVSVSSALAEYASNEDEFASVVAHELAHNILQHRARLDAMNVSRGFGRQFGKSKNAIRATETEADKLSVWVLANAGYDPKAAVTYWRHYGPKYGKGIFADGTHANWKERVEILQAEIARMTQARQLGQRWPSDFPQPEK